MSGRASFAILDAGLSSVGNFAFSWVGALLLPLAEFGVLSLLMVVGLLFQALVKALVVDAYTLGFAAEDRTSQTSAGGDVLGAVFSVGLAWSFTVALVWAVSGEDTGWAALAAVSVPLAMHDAARWIAFAQGRVRLAASGTAVWTVLSAGSVGALVLWDSFSATTAVLCWGLTSAVSASLMIGLLGVSPRPGRTLGWFRRHSDVGLKSSTDFALTQSVAYGGGVAVSLIAGPAAFGLLRLAQLPLAGVQILITGSISAIQPALVRRARSAHVAGALRLASVVAVTLVGAIVLCTAVIVVVPDRIWVVLLGDSWPDAAVLVPVLALGLIGSALASCAGPFLRAIGMLRREVLIKTVVTPVTLVGIAVGVALGGVGGAAVAMSLGAVVTGCVLAEAARRSAQAPSRSRAA